jgi:hypothetical protein
MLHDDGRFDNDDMQIEIRKSVSKSVAQKKNVNENRFHPTRARKTKHEMRKTHNFQKKKKSYIVIRLLLASYFLLRHRLR